MNQEIDSEEPLPVDIALTEIIMLTCWNLRVQMQGVEYDLTLLIWELETLALF